MPKFTIEILDRATVDISAQVEIEAADYKSAVAHFEAHSDEYDLEWEIDRNGIGWWDQQYEYEFCDLTISVDEE